MAGDQAFIDRVQPAPEIAVGQSFIDRVQPAPEMAGSQAFIDRVQPAPEMAGDQAFIDRVQPVPEMADAPWIVDRQPLPEMEDAPWIIDGKPVPEMPDQQAFIDHVQPAPEMVATQPQPGAIPEIGQIGNAISQLGNLGEQVAQATGQISPGQASNIANQIGNVANQLTNLGGSGGVADMNQLGNALNQLTGAAGQLQNIPNQPGLNQLGNILNQVGGLSGQLGSGQFGGQGGSGTLGQISNILGQVGNLGNQLANLQGQPHVADLGKALGELGGAGQQLVGQGIPSVGPVGDMYPPTFHTDPGQLPAVHDIPAEQTPENSWPDDPSSYAATPQVAANENQPSWPDDPSSYDPTMAPDGQSHVPVESVIANATPGGDHSAMQPPPHVSTPPHTASASHTVASTAHEPGMHLVPPPPPDVPPFDGQPHLVPPPPPFPFDPNAIASSHDPSGNLVPPPVPHLGAPMHGTFDTSSPSDGPSHDNLSGAVETTVATGDATQVDAPAVVASEAPQPMVPPTGFTPIDLSKIKSYDDLIKLVASSNFSNILPQILPMIQQAAHLDLRGVPQVDMSQLNQAVQTAMQGSDVGFMPALEAHMLLAREFVDEIGPSSTVVGETATTVVSSKLDRLAAVASVQLASTEAAPPAVREAAVTITVHNAIPQRFAIIAASKPSLGTRIPAFITENSLLLRTPGNFCAETPVRERLREILIGEAEGAMA
jgi:hypothetical protein